MVGSGVAATYIVASEAAAANKTVVGVGKCPDPSAPGGYGPEIISSIVISLGVASGTACIEGTLPDGRKYATPSTITATRFGAFPSSWNVGKLVMNSVAWTPAGGTFVPFTGLYMYSGFNYSYVDGSGNAQNGFIELESPVHGQSEPLNYPYTLDVTPNTPCASPETFYINQ